jgi:hypothetical protein
MRMLVANALSWFCHEAAQMTSQYFTIHFGISTTKVDKIEPPTVKILARPHGYTGWHGSILVAKVKHFQYSEVRIKYRLDTVIL